MTTQTTYQDVMMQEVASDNSRSLPTNTKRALVGGGYGGGAAFRGLRVIAIGDSITAYGSASGWLLYVQAASNTRINLVKDAAVPGETAPQMVARFDTAVTPFASDADELWIMTGANDAATGTASNVFAADLSQLIQKGIDVGLRVRVFATPPRDTAISAALRLREVTMDTAISMGVDCYDPWQTCVNPATGGFNAADTLDGVHPSAAGHTKAGQAVMSLLAIPTTHAVALPVQNALNGGMFANPLFVTDTGADGLADGMVVAGSGVASLVASSFGNKQRLTATALTGPTYIQTNPVLVVTPGNTYSVKGKLTVTGVNHAWYLRIRWQTIASIDTGNLYVWNGQANVTGEFDFHVTAPDDAARLAIQWSFTKQSAKPDYTATMDIEQFQIVDLTAIGLA